LGCSIQGGSHSDEHTQSGSHAPRPLVHRPGGVRRRAGFGGLGRLDADQDRRYFAITVRPQVFLNLVPDRVIAHRMFPLAADRTVVECDWLFDPGVVEVQQDLSASVELFHRVNEQDFGACERCQPSMSSRGYAAGGVLVPSEHHLAGFHHWVREMAGGAAGPISER
jgi:Rieske 2Fe-2S family protein